MRRIATTAAGPGAQPLLQLVPHEEDAPAPAGASAETVVPDARQSACDRPLYVDLDGTLISSDLLIESLFALLRRNPLYLFLVPWWLLRGRAHLKQMIAARVDLDAASLPYRRDLVSHLEREHASGRRIVLASASDARLVKAVAAHLGIFSGVLASDGAINLKGRAKLAAIRADAHGQPFDYAGNEAADLPVLRQATQAILVAPDRRLAASAPSLAREPLVFASERAGLKTYLKAIRIHQWLKNCLLLVPLVLDHRLLDGAAWQAVALAFLAFGLTASAIYLVNDLVDLSADRQHASKRNRPLAAGTLPLAHGLALVPVLLAGAGLLTLALPAAFAQVLALYLASTLSYSLYFKRTLLLDVLMLAGLYTLRIIAGAVATGIAQSYWLLAFSIFLFFSLSLVKRFVELRSIGGKGERKLRNRGYRVEDTETLAQFGTASGLMAVLVLALYVHSPEVNALYGRPEVLWLLCPVLLYIICRFWILARRDEMHDDPLVFAATDWRSLSMAAIAGALILAAT